MTNFQKYIIDGPTFPFSNAIFAFFNEKLSCLEFQQEGSTTFLTFPSHAGWLALHGRKLNFQSKGVSE